jgi:RND family efflux transporter MFP subunit
MKPKIIKTTVIIAAFTVMAVAFMVLKIPSLTRAKESKSDAVLGVSVTRPNRYEWPVEISASGSVVAWQEAVIGAETGGLSISALHADVGDKVKKGQILAEFTRDSVQAEVLRYEAALASARASLAQAVANADRAKVVKGSGALSEQQISEYLANEKTAKANVDLAKAQLAVQNVTLAQTRIKAVDDGVITSRTALLGQVVSIGTELFHMQRQGRLEWKAEVDATQLPQIKPDAKSAITLPSGEVVEGTVRLAEPTLSTSTGRAFVYVRLPEMNFATSGMFAEGRIEAGLNSVLAVPESAVVLRDGRSYVFEVGGDNKVIRRTVTVGQHRGNMVEISMGIAEQASIVTSGGAFLADGDLVTVEKES